MGGVSGRDDNVDTFRIAAEKRAIEIGADFNVYTHGSASGGLMDGGTGVVVTQFRLRLYDGEVPASLVPMRKKRGFWRKRYTKKRVSWRKPFFHVG